MLSNAALFRRFAYAEDAMLRAAMPRTAAREAAQMKDAAPVVEKVAAPLTFTLADIEKAS